MTIEGKWHREGSAAQSSASLTCFGNTFTLNTEDGLSISGLLSDIRISDRLGNVERKLTLEDGSVFATKDNDAVDAFAKENRSTKGIIHAIESHLGWAGLALVCTIFFGFAFFKWGIPSASNVIAKALPHKANEIIAEGALDFLDKLFFEESALSEERQRDIREHFNTRLLSLDTKNDHVDYQLLFRSWPLKEGKGIPNALALPSGQIILTDTFVELSESQDEIDAVLLHEIGHVVHRHTLKMVVEGTIVTTAIMLATGDNSTLADMGIGLGSLLISTSYSRGHESEADTYAFQKMLEANIDPISFSNILNRMTDYMENIDADDLAEEREKQQAASKPDSNILDYISSHPKTDERSKNAQRYSDCFHQGKRECE